MCAGEKRCEQLSIGALGGGEGGETSGFVCA